MLQAILEERFKIKVHKEVRDVAVDALVVANGGAKLQPFVEGVVFDVLRGFVVLMNLIPL